MGDPGTQFGYMAPLIFSNIMKHFNLKYFSVRLLFYKFKHKDTVSSAELILVDLLPTPRRCYHLRSAYTSLISSRQSRVGAKMVDVCTIKNIANQSNAERVFAFI